MNGTQVFGPLAEDYARYRPGYPMEMIDVLTRECGLTSDLIVADIGSGTGNLTRLFLEVGCRTIGVEPNREMREAAEHLLATYRNFHSLDGSAESIPLEADSVDMLAIGQALHWFDLEKARAEFRRILRPNGWIAVTWNDRRTDATAFTREYDNLTRAFTTEQPSPCHGPFRSDNLDRLFCSAVTQKAHFPHTQSFDLDGLIGRARSSGFIPQPGAPEYDKFTSLMTDLFSRHQSDGLVQFHYNAWLYFGHLGE